MWRYIMAAAVTACLSCPCGTAQELHTGSLLEVTPSLWLNERAQQFDLRSLQGHPTVLTMAYASCHQICPGTIARLLTLQKRFDHMGVEATFVIVGYDPEADDFRAWQQYRQTRHLARSNWHFLIGSVTQVAQFARVFGFEFWKADQHILHDSRVIYIDSAGMSVVDPVPEMLTP